MDARSWGLLLTLSFIWGFSFLFIGAAGREIPPMTLALLRVAGGAAALWVYIAVTRTPIPRAWGVWGALAVMGLLNNAIPFSLLMYGQQTIESGLAAIFNATTPVFAVIVAHLFTRDEKATPLKVAGVLVALLGAGLVIGVEALETFDMRSIAQIAILGTALSYAFAGVWGKRFAGLPKPVVAAGMLTTAALWLAPAALMFEETPAQVSAITAGSVAALAVICTSAAYLLYFAILERAGATNLLLVTILAAPVAAVLGYIFLDESLTLEALIGGGVILIGLSLIDGRLWKSWRL